jgi:ADP-ribose pyrophosphatase YjhB (NUDIX family)
VGTPDFVLALRAKIGNDLLWLPGVTAVVLRGPEVLLVKRADNRAWTPVTGIVDPGEEPAVAAIREVGEEAAVGAVVEKLAGVSVVPTVTYANGDRSAYLDLTFRCRWTSGDPYPADGENTEAAFFPLDGLPPLDPAMRRRIESALDPSPAARFTAP